MFKTLSAVTYKFHWQWSQDLTTGFEHFLWMHFCFMILWPPNLLLSLQKMHWPQSGRTHPEHLRQGQSLCLKEHFFIERFASSTSADRSAKPCFFTTSVFICFNIGLLISGFWGSLSMYCLRNFGWLLILTLTFLALLKICAFILTFFVLWSSSMFSFSSDTRDFKRMGRVFSGRWSKSLISGRVSLYLTKCSICLWQIFFSLIIFSSCVGKTSSISGSSEPWTSLRTLRGSNIVVSSLNLLRSTAVSSCLRISWHFLQTSFISGESLGWDWTSWPDLQASTSPGWNLSTSGSMSILTTASDMLQVHGRCLLPCSTHLENEY